MRLLAGFLILLSGVVSANQPMDKAEYLQICTTMSEVAGRIMMVRQLGMPMSDAMSVVGGEKVFEDFVADAYSIHRRDTDEGRKQAVSDFKDRIYLRCFKEMPEELNP